MASTTINANTPRKRLKKPKAGTTAANQGLMPNFLHIRQARNVAMIANASVTRISGDVRPGGGAGRVGAAVSMGMEFLSACC